MREGAKTKDIFIGHPPALRSETAILLDPEQDAVPRKPHLVPNVSPPLPLPFHTLAKLQTPSPHSKDTRMLIHFRSIQPHFLSFSPATATTPAARGL